MESWLEGRQARLRPPVLFRSVNVLRVDTTSGLGLRFHSRCGGDPLHESGGTGSTGYRLLSGYTLKQGESS